MAPVDSITRITSSFAEIVAPGVRIPAPATPHETSNTLASWMMNQRMMMGGSTGSVCGEGIVHRVQRVC